MSWEEVCRRPERRRFYATRLSGAAIVPALERRGPVLITDLSLGPGRPHHMAHELAAQFGVRLPRIVHSWGSNDSAQNIDAEMRGDLCRLAALDCARTLVVSLNRREWHVVVLTPRAGAVWGEANITFLEFVSDILVAADPRITLVLGPANSFAPAPDHWLLVPNSIPRANPAGPHEYVNERHRSHPGLVPGGAAVLASGLPVWRTARGARFIDVRLRDSSTLTLPGRNACLVRSAYAALAAGDSSLALGLAERAYALAHSEVQGAELLYPLQCIRVRVAHYREAAAATFPLEGIPDALLKQLLGCTGYAAAMQGDPELA